MHSSGFFSDKAYCNVDLKRKISGSHTISDQSLLLNTIVLNDMCLLTAEPPMTAPTITGRTPLSSTSFIVNLTITNPDYNYIITWTNMCTKMMEGSMTASENTNSYTVAGLNGHEDYSVTVTANNSCGMNKSDPITVFSKDQCYAFHDFAYTL